MAYGIKNQVINKVSTLKQLQNLFNSINYVYILKNVSVNRLLRQHKGAQQYKLLSLLI